MDLWILKPGHKIKTFEGAEAEVLSETEDGEWIRIRYLDDQDDPLFSIGREARGVYVGSNDAVDRAAQRGIGERPFIAGQ